MKASDLDKMFDEGKDIIKYLGKYSVKCVSLSTKVETQYLASKYEYNAVY